MNKKLLALALAVITLFLAGCNNKNDDMDNTNKENNSTSDTKIELQNGEVIFKARVTSVENSDFIEGEIVDSDVAFGIYWVLVSDLTEFYDINGNSISRSDINVGDTIQIVFGGQVMNSFPPKISARRIYLH